MASNYLHVERPVKINNQCIFCDKNYKVYKTKNEETNRTKTTHESRSKIFESKKNKPTISERLSNVNLQVENDPELSNTICDKCVTKIDTLDKAKEIKATWSWVKRNRLGRGA